MCVYMTCMCVNSTHDTGEIAPPSNKVVSAIKTFLMFMRFLNL